MGYGTAGAILKNNYNKKGKATPFQYLEIRVTQFQETEYNNNEKKNKIRSSRLVIRAGKTLWQKKKRMWGERGPFSIIQLKRITVFSLQKYGPPGGVGSP